MHLQRERLTVPDHHINDHEIHLYPNGVRTIFQINDLFFTVRQIEILHFYAQKISQPEIGKMLGIRAQSVQNELQRFKQKNNDKPLSELIKDAESLILFSEQILQLLQKIAIEKKYRNYYPSVNGRKKYPTIKEMLKGTRFKKAENILWKNYNIHYYKQTRACIFVIDIFAFTLPQLEVLSIVSKGGKKQLTSNQRELLKNLRNSNSNKSLRTLIDRARILDLLGSENLMTFRNLIADL